MITTDAEKLPEKAIQRRAAWYRRFVFWRIISWALTAIIACGSALVASSLFGEHSQGRNIVAVAVATCAALQAALAPDVKANAFRRAWIGLDLVLQEMAGLTPALMDAIRKGEAEIDTTHAVPPSANPTAQKHGATGSN